MTFITAKFYLLNLVETLSRITPAIPEKTEARMIAAFASSMRASFLPNASKETKMDMVKPTPPKKPIAIKLFHLTFAGVSEILVFTASQIAEQIPTGFPIKRPIIIPNEIGLLNS